jgi:hypothetical protein
VEGIVKRKSVREGVRFSIGMRWRLLEYVRKRVKRREGGMKGNVS